MALGPEFYERMFNRIKSSGTPRADLFAESANQEMEQDSLFTPTQSVGATQQIDNDDVEIVDYDTSSIDPEGDGPLNLAFASTIDTVTQRIKLHYIYYTDRHKKAVNQLFCSIMNYISSTIPVGANMTPDQFFSYVTDFYKERLQGFIDDPDGTKNIGVMELYNTQFTKIQAAELITALEKFIESADNVAELKDICAPLNTRSVRDKESKLDLFRGMASVITVPEKTPGDEKFGNVQ